MATACPTCGEVKKVSVAVASASERNPYSTWRYHCTRCGHAWTTKDSNG